MTASQHPSSAQVRAAQLLIFIYERRGERPTPFLEAMAAGRPWPESASADAAGETPASRSSR